MNQNFISKIFVKRYDQIGLICFGILILLPSLAADFSGDNLNQISAIKSNLFGLNYGYFRPVSSLINWMDYLIWGANPIGYHLTNLILHLLNVMMVYRICTILFKNSALSLLSGLFFLLHPIHAMNIFWISGRSDMLCALFLLISFYLFLKFHDSGKINLYIFSLIFFIISLFSKEMAISLPFIILFYLIIFSEQPVMGKISNALKRSGPYFIIMILYFISRYMILPEQEFSNVYHSNIRFLHLIKNLASYLGLLIIPGGHITIANFLNSSPLVFLLISLILIVLFMFLTWYLRKSQITIFILLFLIISLFPVIRLVMRWYLYIPSIAYAILLAYLIFYIPVNWKRKTYFQVTVSILIGVVFLFFLLTEQNRWIQSGRLAKKISHEIADEMKNNQLDEVIFLNNISELEETPVLIFGLSSFVNFASFNSFDRINELKVYPAASISLGKEDDLKNIIVGKEDSLTFRIDLNSTVSYFNFPKQAELVSKQKRIKTGVVIENKYAHIQIEKINRQYQATSLKIMLKQSNLPVMYYSQGNLILSK